MYWRRTPYEQTLDKQGMLLFGSHILWRTEGEVKSLYKKAIAVFSYIKFDFSDTVIF